MTEDDVAWADEMLWANENPRCEIREGLTCGCTIETTGPDYATTHKARLKARREHTHEEAKDG